MLIVSCHLQGTQIHIQPHEARYALLFATSFPSHSKLSCGGMSVKICWSETNWRQAFCRADMGMLMRNEAKSALLHRRLPASQRVGCVGICQP